MQNPKVVLRSPLTMGGIALALVAAVFAFCYWWFEGRYRQALKSLFEEGRITGPVVVIDGVKALNDEQWGLVHKDLLGDQKITVENLGWTGGKAMRLIVRGKGWSFRRRVVSLHVSSSDFVLTVGELACTLAAAQKGAAVGSRLTSDGQGGYGVQDAQQHLQEALAWQEALPQHAAEWQSKGITSFDFGGAQYVFPISELEERIAMNVEHYRAEIASGRAGDGRTPQPVQP